MLFESLELNVLLGMFGLFLLGLWLEARRTLRALAEESLMLEDGADSAFWESDYETVMLRREARRRLAHLRVQARQEAARKQKEARFDEPEYSGARYDLQIPEFRLIEGGRIAKNEIFTEDESLDNGEVFTTGGARTPMTREGRKIA
jgi:hypothetical protein